jgi:NAD(P)-dependent dehydrogenase (short-subunit alcohol dehydrogenase family)
MTPNEIFDLTDRVVIVTGGSRGLGRAMVGAFAEAGADVVIASRKFDSCVAAADEIRSTTGRRALPYACHVGHWDELEPLVDAAYSEFGRVDVLVNNAGMSPLYDSAIDITEDLWDKVMAVNLKGPFRLATLVASRMLEADGGSIINVSSAGSTRPAAHIIPYASAKAGLNALTISLAHTFGPKVRVNTLMPGPFKTDISASWGEGSAGLREGMALQRIGNVDEIVGGALYLASDASSYASGSTVQVDGGLR